MKVQVKICGIRSLEAAKAALVAGADFVGFNFVESSRRRISPKDAKEISGKIKGQIKTVGVFQNADLDYVNELVESLGLDYVQLHGNEDPKYVKGVSTKVIKTISMVKNVSFDRYSNLMKKYEAAYFLLDRETQGEGDMIGSENAKKIADKFPVFFAGGLNPENVSTIVKKVKPFVVDVAGGIETNGIQDIDKIRLFIELAKGVSL